MIQQVEVTKQIPTARVFLPLLEPRRYKGAHGGRGSAKSHFFGELMIERAMIEPGLRAVCIREVQRSLEQSVKRLLDDKIAALGWGGAFRSMDTQIRTPGDGLIIFQGMQNHTAESIKSLEGYDIAWVEEAQSLSARSLKLLRPTIRKAGSELWFSWNPNEATDPVDAFLRSAEPPPDSAVVETNWEDNPWFPDVLRAEKDYDYSNDPDGAEHVWGGGYWARSDAQIFAGKWRVAEFEPKEDWNGPYQGADWGFSAHPSVLIRVWIHDERLWIEYEAQGLGVDIGAATARLFEQIPFAKQYAIRADNARPETISAMRNLGWKVSGAPKWPGSVEDGIEHLRGYREIVIHPRCKKQILEAKQYSYKVDKLTGDVLRDIVKAHDHGWDAIRYALAPVIRKRSWRPI